MPQKPSSRSPSPARQPERERERKPPTPNEPKEGMPGYGQPPEDVRWKNLPDQSWEE